MFMIEYLLLWIYNKCQYGAEYKIVVKFGQIFYLTLKADKEIWIERGG